MPTEQGGGGRSPSPAPTSVRDVVLTTQFKKDFRREDKGRHRATLRAALQAVVVQLANDVALPRHMADHPLGGHRRGHRDCHIKPDLVLIYRKIEPSEAAPSGKPRLSLVRLGSHSELGI